MIISRSTHVAANGILILFLWLSNFPLGCVCVCVCVRVYTPHLLYPFRKMYILDKIPLTKIWITDWERGEYYKTRARKTSLKALTGIQVRDDGAEKKGMEILETGHQPSDSVSDWMLEGEEASRRTGLWLG